MSGADTAIAGLTGNVSGAIILGAGTASDTASDIMECGGTEEDVGRLSSRVDSLTRERNRGKIKKSIRE